jgi:hypothetical protein
MAPKTFLAAAFHSLSAVGYADLQNCGPAQYDPAQVRPHHPERETTLMAGNS